MKSIRRWIAGHPLASKILVTVMITAFCFVLLDPDVYSFGIRFAIVFSLLCSGYLTVNYMPDKLMRQPLEQLEQHCDPYPFLAELELQIAKPREDFQGQMIRLNYAMALVHTGAHEQALQVLEDINPDRFSNPFARFIYCNNLCDVMTRLDRFQEAEIWYNKTSKIYQDLPNNRLKQRLARTMDMNEIEALYREGDYAFALRKLSRIPCPTQRSVMEAALLAARCNLALAEYDKAKEKLQYVIDHGNRLHCVAIAKALLDQIS